MVCFIIKSPKYGDKTFIIDDEDLGRISQYKWCLKKDKDNFYAHAVIDGRRGVFKMGTLHRFVMDAKPNEIIDHINRNTQDNRKSNLRVVTNQQNAYNSRLFKTNSTGIKGVYKSNNGKKWIAKIRYNNKLIHLGTFDTKEQASSARIAKEKVLNIFD